MKTDNEKYIRRGQALIIHDDPERCVEVKKANRHKVGAPFQYADSFFASLAAVKSMIHIPYRNLMGMILKVLDGEKVPHYTTIFRRIQSLDVRRSGRIVTVAGSRGVAVLFAVDSTGLKQHNRGEWIRQKWQVRRGFVKLHILVDVDTKKILAVRVTDDRTGDSPMFIPLLDDALKNRVPRTSESGRAGGSTRCSAYGDGAYASRDNLKACRERNVTPLIKLKVSSTPKGKGAGDVWGMAVWDQFGGSNPNQVKWLPDDEKKNNQKEWKARVGYGKRWIVEIVFSAFKRMFGEYISARKWENVKTEIYGKVQLYNQMIDMAIDHGYGTPRIVQVYKPGSKTTENEGGRR